MELSEDLIKRRSKHFDLACVTLLDLSGAEIGRLAHLDKCTNLVEINLQHNLALDLTGNQLTSIDNLPPCPALEELSFAKANEVASVDFQALATKGNPVCSHKDVAALVRAALPNLLLLNGEALALANIGPAISTASTPSGPPDAAPTKFAGAKFDASAMSFDVDNFIEQSSRRIDELLLQCHKTLESETARVQQAFNATTLQ
ncbi:hypothetical protein PybrP1_009654 [[Pythium] brassicae (nom. inval.)]|nr:hypothetical protein PybrP1_009654 [[Pythium] brassicae (nom. inval.)]